MQTGEVRDRNESQGLPRVFMSDWTEGLSSLVPLSHVTHKLARCAKARPT
jgi:hypothetical protein